VTGSRGSSALLALALTTLTTAACERPAETVADAGSAADAAASVRANEGEGTSVDRAAHGADGGAAGGDAVPGMPGGHAAAWNNAFSKAMTVPCRAIAVDGHVAVETEADAAAPVPLALRDELPSDVWLALAADSRVVAKDPRTTRETAFNGPARVQVCVSHREESWLASGTFESAMGAGESPGADEWVATPLGVVRYVAAQVRVEVRDKDLTVTLANGAAFLWLADDARPAPARAAKPADGGPAAATTSVDDDGWLRMSTGVLGIARTAPRPPMDAATAAAGKCLALNQEVSDLATQLIAGALKQDASVAKDEVRARLGARAACTVAALRAQALPPSPARTALLQRLDAGRGVRGLPNAPL
jgi:hypothetical protein